MDAKKERELRINHAKIVLSRGLALIKEGSRQLASERAMVRNPLADSEILGKGLDLDSIPDDAKQLDDVDNYVPTRKGARSSSPEGHQSKRARHGRIAK